MLDARLHFHCVVIDGLFEPAPAGGVVFHAATRVEATAIELVQESVRQRLLHGFVRRDLLPSDAAQAMAEREHGGGFSVDASVDVAATDRAGSERLLRHGARPPFTPDRLRELDAAHLSYESIRPDPGGTGPPRQMPLGIYRHLCFDVLARTAAHWRYPRRPGTTAHGRSPPATVPVTTAVVPHCRRAEHDCVALAMATPTGLQPRSLRHSLRGSPQRVFGRCAHRNTRIPIR